MDKSTLASIDGRLAKVSGDLSLRLNESELSIVMQVVGERLNSEYLCVVGQCLGGALEKWDNHFWDNDALTAQVQCNTSVSFDDAMSKLDNKEFVSFLRGKADSAKSDTAKGYKSQESQDTDRVIQKGKEAGEFLKKEIKKELADIGGDLTGGVSFIKGVLIVVAIVAVVAGALIINKELERVS